MGESLNPTLITRISQALRPDWARTVLARRVVAGALVLLAGVAAIRSNPQGDQVEVVVASRDIAPGTALTVDDVSLESRSAQTVPEGAATDMASVLHATLAGPARRGEILTDVRLLGSRLTEAAAGPGARIVGVHPADAALIDLVRPGDVVDIVTTAPEDPAGPPGAPRVVAGGGIVVLVSDKHNHDDRVVLVALPATAAVAVAGATLAQAVTLTLR
ncbi:SAF domain-containing protein [Mycolicibacter longobardus]|uniref:Flagellar biosynthesis protein FlgA n=1 Tax=Mycolicibacter longobardus TaxID=1108812 RepID=A0A1X1YQU2_9MYCO|nr:SAF domain-containing protein [Mycolicibacter longobardus]MCV7382805.1 flagellar biosynthesis protein FlgA [Mycolicibacter longobardus]ORW13499.1 flagellar biosynthesis protein FlgA [Mycolicibacter longobardus]